MTTPNIVDHIKTRMTEVLPAGIPDGWIVMNAPRPLLGTKTMEGEFITGRFYAAIDPADQVAERFIEKNRELDARLLVSMSRDAQMELAMHGNRYRDQYLALDADTRFKRLSGALEKLRDMPYADLAKLISDAAGEKPAMQDDGAGSLRMGD